MNKESSVTFKGGRNGINIILSSDVSFDEIKEQLTIKVSEASRFFGKSKTTITFKGRKLSKEQENECLDIINKGTEMDITYALKPEFELNNVKKLEKEEIGVEDSMTKYFFGAIRSGQSIKYKGSVVVMGDVNPGGEIIAEGNVVVVGTLKGIVHAGCMGRTDVFISAIKMAPVQLRIADQVIIFPDEVMKEKNKQPKYAHMVNGKIFVKEL